MKEGDPLQPNAVPSAAAPAAPGPPAAASAHSAASDHSEFTAVRGAPQAGTSAELVLVLAYILMWTVLLAFVYFGFRRQRRLAQRIEHLEHALGAAEQDARKE